MLNYNKFVSIILPFRGHLLQSYIKINMINHKLIYILKYYKKPSISEVHESIITLMFLCPKIVARCSFSYKSDVCLTPQKVYFVYY